MSFSIHQVAEYVLGLGLIAQAVQGSRGHRCRSLLGAAILVSAAVTDGPLAGWKVVSPPGPPRGRHRAGRRRAGRWRCCRGPSSDLTSRAVLVVTAALLGAAHPAQRATPPSPCARRGAGVTWPRMSGRSAGRVVGRTREGLPGTATPGRTILRPHRATSRSMARHGERRRPIPPSCSATGRSGSGGRRRPAG